MSRLLEQRWSAGEGDSLTDNTIMPSRDSHAERRASESGIGAAKTARMKLVLTSSDIRDLYEAARALGGLGGAPYLNRLFDADAALSSGAFDRVQEILSNTRREFEKSHTRLLRFQSGGAGNDKRPREDARLDSKKKQVEEVLALLDAYIRVAERMARVAERAPPQEETPIPRQSPAQESHELPDEFVDAFHAETTPDAQFAVVSRYFQCEAVDAADHVTSDGLYFLRTRKTGYLLGTAAHPQPDRIRLIDAFTGEEAKPQPTEALVEQGTKGKFFRLTPSEEGSAEEPPIGDEPEGSAASDPLEAQTQLLDRQLFNVLMMAVRQSGLGFSTELIVQVRDNQFRKGEYHDAFEKLNQFATRFETAAARRKEELRRHDQWLSSGQSGLSMREVEEAKLRNAQERTRLEHANHRFGLVVEPLRILSRGS